MIYQFPQTTKDLAEQIQVAIDKMPAKDKNLFIQDLIKFCLDWQFNYLAFRESEKNNGIQGR